MPVMQNIKTPIVKGDFLSLVFNFINNLFDSARALYLFSQSLYFKVLTPEAWHLKTPLCFYLNSSSSTSSQMIWLIVICASCIRAVTDDGTIRDRSAHLANSPLLPPVKQIVLSPISFAFFIARSTFFALPLVDMPMAISPGLARASNCRENTIS